MVATYVMRRSSCAMRRCHSSCAAGRALGLLHMVAALEAVQTQWEEPQGRGKVQRPPRRCPDADEASHHTSAIKTFARSAMTMNAST
mmetsp:Transcript_28249/g.93911  ORF Transcript_28249/g.93911 Transcript_28249/m.93911 type:complete len:87 (-) Transcript_28249:654-914(-)